MSNTQPEYGQSQSEETQSDQVINAVVAASKYLYEDPMSEATRKRQTALLVASVLTALISLAIISPVEGSFGGIKFLVEQQDAVRLTLGLVTLYYFASYALSFAGDRIVYRHHTLINERQYVQVLINMTLPQSEAYRKWQVASDEISAEIDRRRRETHERLRAEWDAEKRSIHEAMRPSLALQDALERLRVAHEVHMRQLEETGSALRQEYEQQIAPVRDELRAAISDFQKKFAVVGRIQRDHRRLMHMRGIIDVVFPLMIGGIALWLSLVPSLVTALNAVLAADGVTEHTFSIPREWKRESR